MDLGGGLGLVECRNVKEQDDLGASRRNIKGRAGTSRSELPVCEWQGSGFPFSHDTGFREPLDLRSNGRMV